MRLTDLITLPIALSGIVAAWWVARHDHPPGVVTPADLKGNYGEPSTPLDDDDPEDDPRTFVVARTRRQAVLWCREHGVPPTSNRTHLVTTPEDLRGWAIRPHDRVVHLSDPPYRTDEPSVGFYLNIARLHGGSL